jgi:ADP-ribose pyrophosphatase
MPSQRAKTLKSELMYTGRVFTVRRDEVSEPGGVRSVRDVLVHNGSVVVMPIFPDGSILLIRQYRYAAKKFLWELVAGHIEPNESQLACARRELVEEAGYTARRFKRLLSFFPSPGVMTEQMWTYVATGLIKCEATPEEDERITSRRFPLASVLLMIKTSKIQDAKTISSVLFYARFSR